jgi:hypothetical protein
MVGMDKISFSEMTSLIKFNFFLFYGAVIHKTMQSTKWQAMWNLTFFVVCGRSKHESCNFTQSHAKHKITSHMKFDLFVPCRTSKHESYNFTQNHAKHKMTHHIKFDLFVLFRTSKTWNITILHKTMQSTKWQATWSLILFVLCRTSKHESYDYTQNHEKHKMTSHMKFDPFCSMQNIKNMKSWDSTQNHAKHKMTIHMKFDVFCSMYRTSKHEILRFYTKPCKAQNDKPHEVWRFLFYV